MKAETFQSSNFTLGWALACVTRLGWFPPNWVSFDYIVLVKIMLDGLLKYGPFLFFFKQVLRKYSWVNINKMVTIKKLKITHFKKLFFFFPNRKNRSNFTTCERVHPSYETKYNLNVTGHDSFWEKKWHVKLGII